MTIDDRLAELEQSHARARHAQLWHDELYDTAPEAFLLYSPSGTILWANRCMQGLFFGCREEDLLLTPDEAIGRNFRDVFHKRLADFVELRNAEVLETGLPQYEDWSDEDVVDVAWQCLRWKTPKGNVGASLRAINTRMLHTCWHAFNA